MDTFVEAPRRRSRRRHSAEFRASVIEACRQPGVSMAAVALANGLNANMLRKWVIDAEQRSGNDRLQLAAAGGPAAKPATSFVPLQLPSSQPVTDIRIELRRGSTAIIMTWPSSAAAECAAWVKEVLR